MPSIRVRTGVKRYEDGMFRAFARIDCEGKTDWRTDPAAFRLEAAALDRAKQIGRVLREEVAKQGLTFRETLNE